MQISRNARDNVRIREAQLWGKYKQAHPKAEVPPEFDTKVQTAKRTRRERRLERKARRQERRRADF